MKKSQEIGQRLRAKADELRAIVGKGESASADEMKRAGELSTEVKGLRGDYDSTVEIEQISAEQGQFVDALTGDVVNLKHGIRVNPNDSHSEAKLHDIYQSGRTDFEVGVDERKRRYIQMAYQEGEGILNEKQERVTASDEYRKAFRTMLRSKGNVSGAELKTLQEGVDGSGGFVVPDDILQMIIQRKPTPTRVSGRVTRLTTSRDRLVIPKVNYSADDIYSTGVRATWTGEIPSSSTAHRVTDPAFGQVGIPVHTAMMSMPVTNDQIEDAMFPLVQWASGKFGETIEILYDDKIINGTGLGQPAGILLSPGAANQPAVVGSGSSGALTADGIINLAFSLPEQYDGENTSFLMNKTDALKKVALLKDSNNRYLFGMGVNDSGLSVPIRDRKLLGYDVMLSQLMPSVSANSYPIVFGDFTGYYLVNRVGFSIQVLRELYAETNQVLLLGRIRLGGQVVEDWKLKIQQAA
jgi:HK97 family phage major capsid protein